MAEMKARVAALEAEAQAQKERTSAAAAHGLREREASQRWQEATEAKHRQEMAEMKAQVAALEAKAQAQKERASAAAMGHTWRISGRFSQSEPLAAAHRAALNPRLLGPGVFIQFCAGSECGCMVATCCCCSLRCCSL